MDWQEEYKRKLVSAEEAVKLVKSGDRVEISNTCEPEALEFALAKRRGELRNVEIHTLSNRADLGWFQPGWEESFTTCPEQPAGIAEPKRFDYPSSTLSILRFKSEDEKRPDRKEIDVFMVVASPPDRNGFCTFGRVLLSKKDYAKKAKKILAEVNDLPETTLRTYGDNFFHVSEIDYFVEHSPSALARRWIWQRAGLPEEVVRPIAGYVSNLIRDGDTLEIGMGATTEALAMYGALDNKRDLGWHSGATFKGIVKLIREGIFTGKRKTLHRSKMVTSAFLADETEEDLAFISNNPLFEMYGMEYMHDIRVIAAHDNFVAINNVLAVDLTGQMTSESLGARLIGIPGGLPPFVIGAMLSKGGRNIAVLPSTASEGTVSRIVPTFERGTIITVPRSFADYVVSEYGVASLLGKSQRERAGELIAIAHPDFRAELGKEAQRLYWP